MAEKKLRSVGELPRDAGEVGEKGGDIWPDDCESTVLVRIGGTAWKSRWDDMMVQLLMRCTMYMISIPICLRNCLR